ncbi:MAG: hypothetical protein ACRCVG_00035 [Methanobacteriaceae archaeon]
MSKKAKLSPKFILNKFKKEVSNELDSDKDTSSIIKDINIKISDLANLDNNININNNNNNNENTNINNINININGNTKSLYEDSLNSKKLAYYLNLDIDFADIIIDLLDNTSSCQISDAIMQVNVNNHNSDNCNGNNNHNTINNNNNNYHSRVNNGVIPSLKAVNNKKTFGRVVTGKTSHNDWGTSLFVIDNAEKGDILFIDASINNGALESLTNIASSSTDTTNNNKHHNIGNTPNSDNVDNICSNYIPSAIWGELTSTSSKNNGLAGTVIYGSCRDIDFLADFDYPVYSCFTVPNAGNPKGLGEVNCEVIIHENENNYKVLPGDFIFADINGVVIIPKESFLNVISKTLDIKIKEITIINQLNEGKSLLEITGLK